MSLKKLYDSRRTLLFRLTLSYAVVFTASSFLTIWICYYKISSIRSQYTDQELVGEYLEFRAIMKEKGFEGVLTELRLENEEEDLSKVFFRILSPEGKLIIASDMRSWGEVGISKTALSGLNPSAPYVLEMLRLPVHRYKIRTIYGLISPEKIFQTGISLEENEKYLAIFRNMFFFIMAAILSLSGIIGWLISRNAVRGIQDVVKTANEISKGAYNKRVEVTHNIIEIEALGNAFNNMLDKIRVLLKNMKEMTDNIAHDLRSPLTRMRGIAEMNLMSDKTVEEYQDMAASTVEECDYLIDMVNTMLDITEIEAGMGEMKTEALNLRYLILQIADLFSPVADENRISMHLDIPDVCRIKGDRHKFQRIIMNLLENAIKFTPAGGEVFLKLTETHKAIRIECRDTGVGIAPDDLPKIFDRFFRADKSRTHAGLGLGLSLVKAIAESLGGSISAESALNKGSVFIVTIPK
jgi:signal transduction histidine kinase